MDMQVFADRLGRVGIGGQDFGEFGGRHAGVVILGAAVEPDPESASLGTGDPTDFLNVA